MIKFTIVTVSLNNISGLERTRTSLRAQNFRDFEWLVMDGGSADGTREAMQLWQSEIRASVSAPDKGIYDAMNKGFAVASGEYVLFMNSGDALAASDVLQKLSDCLQKKPSDFIYGDSLEEQTNGATFYKRARSHRFIWWGMFTHHQAMVFRTERLRQFAAVYDARFPLAADLDLVWRCMKQSDRISRVNFAVARCARSGISADYAADGRREQMVMRHEYGRMPALLNALVLLAQKTVWAIKQKRPEIYRLFRLQKSAVNS